MARSSNAETPPVACYAGLDPETRKRSYLRKTIKGTDKAAYKKAEDKLAEFRTQVAKQQSTTSTVPFGHATDECMKTTEIEDSTRSGYVNYIERYIGPALGKVPARKVDARTIECFYNEIRRCRIKCDNKPFIEKHATKDEHDCVLM